MLASSKLGWVLHLECSLHDALDVGPEGLDPNGLCNDADGFRGLGPPAQGILLNTHMQLGFIVIIM